MNKISIVTSAYVDKNNLDESYMQLKECGFDGVDLSVDSIFKTDEPGGIFMEDMETIKKHFEPERLAAVRAGVEFCQAHAPFPIYYPGEDELNRTIIGVLKKHIRLMEYLKCPYIVIHPTDSLRYSVSAEEEKRVNMEIYKQLIPTAVECGVTILLENLFKNMHPMVVGIHCESACTDSRDAAEWIDELNKAAGREVFGICFDVGHAFLMKKDVRHAMNTLGHRIKAFHIHDNDGQFDNHVIPFTYPAAWHPHPYNDWNGFIKGLQDIKYGGALSFETGRSGTLCPKEVHPELLKLTSAIGRYFAGQIKK